MSLMGPADHVVQAETIRRLRLKLAETENEQERHVLLRQIEALEEQAAAAADESGR